MKQIIFMNYWRMMNALFVAGFLDTPIGEINSWRYWRWRPWIVVRRRHRYSCAIHPDQSLESGEYPCEEGAWKHEEIEKDAWVNGNHTTVPAGHVHVYENGHFEDCNCEPDHDDIDE